MSIFSWTEFINEVKRNERDASSNDIGTEELNEEINREGARWSAGERDGPLNLLLGRGLPDPPDFPDRSANEKPPRFESDPPPSDQPVADVADVDWSRYASPPRDQRPTMACVAMAIVAAIEANLRIRRHNGNLRVRLSPGALQYCENGPPNRGWAISSGLHAAMTRGVPDEKCQPWSTRGGCRRCPDWERRAVKIKSYEVQRTIEERKAALRKGPVIAGMTLFSDFERYRSGIYKVTRHARNLGQHAVVVLGYDEDEGYWLIQNSYGKHWGDNGIGKVAMGDERLAMDIRWGFYSIGEILAPENFFELPTPNRPRDNVETPFNLGLFL